MDMELDVSFRVTLTPAMNKKVWTASINFLYIKVSERNSYMCILFISMEEQRISCVHTQVLEMGNNCSGSVNALIYFRGELYSGYADGSIKVRFIK